ncbi:hypothetical protein PYH37_004296 [Sinorhizobium numidicum]|uniref:Transmembrane protein n=1 Tax=Sinorhizobium numidicum TaxID=680248 RepID=A0ABY8CZ87_9HYPH|nr:hypothetical protein [Sinorhizobium numidicum]WEX76029.1 hypothetical protein PYH37_004296 [Sinorhizobium numidicum]WEX82688.1 hypothetical protein PYH38_005008 [Sinorhizobium numidicum]
MRTVLAITLSWAMIAVYSQSSRYVYLPGYAYKTDPTCKRTEPPSKFDRRCDYPTLGFPDFTPPPTIGTGAI